MVQNYIGAPILRKEDRRFLMGRARFTDDVKLPHMLHAAIIRSPSCPRPHQVHRRLRGSRDTRRGGGVQRR